MCPLRYIYVSSQRIPSTEDSPKVFSPRWRALQLTELISDSPIYYGLLIYARYVCTREGYRGVYRERQSAFHRRPKIRSWRIRASVCRIRSGFPCADTRVTLCAFEQDVCSAAGARVCNNVRHIDSRPLAPFPPSLSFSVISRAHCNAHQPRALARTFCSRATNAL